MGKFKMNGLLKKMKIMKGLEIYILLIIASCLIYYLFVQNRVTDKFGDDSPGGSRICTQIKGCTLVANKPGGYGQSQGTVCKGIEYHWYHTYYDDKKKEIVELTDKKTEYPTYFERYYDWYKEGRRENHDLERIAQQETRNPNLKRLMSQGVRCNAICENDDNCIARTQYTSAPKNCALIKRHKGTDRLGFKGLVKSDLTKHFWDRKTICWQKHFELTSKVEWEAFARAQQLHSKAKEEDYRRKQTDTPQKRGELPVDFRVTDDMDAYEKSAKCCADGCYKTNPMILQTSECKNK